jgi:hypothetical protein
MAGLVDYNFKYLNDKVEQSDLLHLRKYLLMAQWTQKCTKTYLPTGTHRQTHNT